MNAIKPKRHKRKCVVYVLTGSHAYESTTVIGVYSTKRRAEKAQAATPINYDYYRIDTVAVNA